MSNKQRFERCAVNLLKKYSTDEGLDTVRVIQAIPEDYNLVDSKNNEIMKYLINVIDHKLTKQINCSIGEKLSAKEHVNVEFKL